MKWAVPALDGDVLVLVLVLRYARTVLCCVVLLVVCLVVLLFVRSCVLDCRRSVAGCVSDGWRKIDLTSTTVQNDVCNFT